MEENLDHMLQNLDFILMLARDCNSTLKRIESRGEIRHINSVPSDDVRDSRVVEDVYVSSTFTSVFEDPLANFDRLLMKFMSFFIVPVAM